jgi:hypothetical protein
MPIIIAAIVAYGTFTGHVIASTGVADQTIREMRQDISPTMENAAIEAHEMLLDSYGSKKVDDYE